MGLGDGILISSALHKIKHNYDNIYVNVNWGLAKTYKSNDSYSNFYRQLLDVVFDDPKFVIDDKTRNPPKMNMEDLIRIGIPPVLPRYQNKLKTKIDENIQSPYLVITTKVREFPRAVYNANKSSIFEQINKLSKKYKIVIMGERVVEMNGEYKIHGESKIYGIYNDIKKHLNNNVLDLTVPKLGITPPTIENLKKDCTIMSGAHAVIVMGAGGNFCLAIAVGKRVIALRNDTYKFADTLLSQSPDMHSAKNPNEFVNLLKTKL